MSQHLLDAEAEFERLWQVYQQQGMVKRAGLGGRPAVLSVDLVRGFTDPSAPMGLHAFGDVVAPSRTVLDAARRAGAPVVLVGSGYDAEFREAGSWERKVTHAGLVHGSEWVEFDEGLGQIPSDHVVVKRYASGFFGTDLVSRLVSQGVDTVLVTGAATSGCVRATAVDALQHGFRVAVVQDAVADRERLPHLASLFDLGTKYADLVTVEEAVAHLSAVGAAAPH
ncbi:isochorismatase family protein [Capillimicrobium parvum]|uniref:Maleamate amidohydrolase n=1 Tax=Capillimicrobium parvum TaxID=2884022 RepID=A0A9E6XZK3_9ACTN|nr:isochorismatase family protein [Capillimicrobium parvum]UGS37294.1 Maleamate amidohydrolase [Capillimicrobium parvum]